MFYERCSFIFVTLILYQYAVKIVFIHNQEINFGFTYFICCFDNHLLKRKNKNIEISQILKFQQGNASLNAGMMLRFA